MKEQFKEFVKKNPILIKYVDSWDKYLESNKTNSISDITKTSAFADFIAFLKTINLDSLQEGIGSIQRVLGVFQDFSGNKDNSTNTDKKEYKPRPLYKHFED